MPITTFRTFPVAFEDSGDIVYPEFAYPYRGWVLAPWVTAVVCLGGPVVTYLISQFIIQSAWDAVHAILGTLWAATLSTFFQVVVKQVIGGFRPYFLEVCQLALSVDESNNKTGLNRVGFREMMYSIDICTQPDLRKLKDAVTSFPSGHAATSMAGIGFFFLWANGKLKPWSDRKGLMWRVSIMMIILLVAVLATCSVAVNGSHNWYNVLGGSLIGAVAAAMSYRCMYAAVWDWRSNHLPLQRTAEH